MIWEKVLIDLWAWKQINSLFFFSASFVKYGPECIHSSISETIANNKTYGVAKKTVINGIYNKPIVRHATERGIDII